MFPEREGNGHLISLRKKYRRITSGFDLYPSVMYHSSKKRGFIWLLVRLGGRTECVCSAFSRLILCGVAHLQSVWGLYSTHGPLQAREAFTSAVNLSWGNSRKPSCLQVQTILYFILALLVINYWWFESFYLLKCIFIKWASLVRRGTYMPLKSLSFFFH